MIWTQNTQRQFKSFFENLTGFIKILQMTQFGGNVVKRDDHYFIQFVSILSQL